MKKILLTIFLASAIWSCGSRKVESEKTKVEIKEDLEIVKEKEVVETQEKKEVVETNTNETTTENEVTITPVDPNKEMIVNGKKYTNAVLTTKNKKSNISTKKKEHKQQVNKTEIKENENLNYESGILIDSKVKNTDKEESMSVKWYFFWFIIILIILIVLYRKFKDKVWFI